MAIVVAMATTAFVSGFSRAYAVGVAGCRRASSAASSGERPAPPPAATAAAARAIRQPSTVPSARSPCGKRAVSRRETAPSMVNTIR